MEKKAKAANAAFAAKSTEPKEDADMLVAGRSLLILVFMAGLGIAAPREAVAGKDVPLAQVPAKVLEAAEKAVPGIQFREAEIERRAKGPVYELEGTAGGKEYDIKVSPEGRVLKVKEEPSGR